MGNFKIKDYNVKDTIAAVATFPATSALGVIKISGKKSLSIISKIFHSKTKKNLRAVRTHTIHYGWIIDKTPERGQRAKGVGQRNSRQKTEDVVVDEVLVSVMRAPSSYTREDVIEVSSHGGAVVLNKILEVILRHGARLAFPGEFTYRALINGRIDVLQAKSVLDVVNAQSFAGVQLALSQLKGESSKRVNELRQRVKDVFVQAEAVVSFPEDELDGSISDIKKHLRLIGRDICDILAGSQQARAMKEGLRCVICGKTNVGKSTLFNRLLKEERVIVSKSAGTTRDVIEETIVIRGVPLRIFDTAGIIEPKDFVDKRAVCKTQEAFNDADIVILVIDGSRNLTKEDKFLIDKAAGKNIILVINKSDLPKKIISKDISKVSGVKIEMSALCAKGLKKLEDAVFKSVHSKSVDRQDMVFLNQYQKFALERARDSIDESLELLQKGYTVDFLYLPLRSCVDYIGKVTGEVLTEELLESIFSNFCIGK